MFKVKEEDMKDSPPVFQFTELTNEEKGEQWQNPISFKKSSSILKDLGNISEKFRKLKENLRNALKQRLSQECKGKLKLSKIFHNKYQAKTKEEKTEEEEHLVKLVELYQKELDVNPF